MKDLTLYDLMGEDHIIYTDVQKNGEIKVVVTTDDNCQEVVYEQISHPYAWESLVYFAQQVIACDCGIELVKEALE